MSKIKITIYLSALVLAVLGVQAHASTILSQGDSSMSFVSHAGGGWGAYYQSLGNGLEGEFYGFDVYMGSYCVSGPCYSYPNVSYYLVANSTSGWPGLSGAIASAGVSSMPEGKNWYALYDSTSTPITLSSSTYYWIAAGCTSSCYPGSGTNRAFAVYGVNTDPFSSGQYYGYGTETGVEDIYFNVAIEDVTESVELYYPVNSTGTIPDFYDWYINLAGLSSDKRYNIEVQYALGPAPFPALPYYTDSYNLDYPASSSYSLVEVDKSQSLYWLPDASTAANWWARVKLYDVTASSSELLLLDSTSPISFWVLGLPTSTTSTSPFVQPELFSTTTGIFGVSSTIYRTNTCPDDWFVGGLCTAWNYVIMPSDAGWTSLTNGLKAFTTKFPFAYITGFVSIIQGLDFTDDTDYPGISFVMPSSTGAFAGLTLNPFSQAGFALFGIEWFPGFVRTMIAWALYVSFGIFQYERAKRFQQNF